MDNLTAPIPSTPTQSAFSSPVGFPNHRWLLWLSCGLAVLTLGIAIGIFSAKFLNQSPSPSQLPSSNSPELPPQSLTSTLIPDPTANWKTHSFQGGFFKYPDSWKTVSNFGTFSGSIHPVVGLAPQSWQSDGDVPPVIIIYYDNPEKLSLADFDKKYYNGEGSGFGPNSRSMGAEQKTISGTSGYYKKQTHCEPLTCSELILPFKDKIYIVTSLYPSSVVDVTQNEIFNQILSTFKFTDETSFAPTSTINTKKLTYFLPSGWKTITDASGILQAGYNSDQFSSTPGNQNIYFNNIQYPVSTMSVSLKPYDGGSRHQFIYNQLGYTAEMAKDEQMDNYHEEEYQYNGWNCLVLYGLGYSAKGTTWGMCAVNSSQALFIEGGNQEVTEKLISTIKIVR